jgi:methionyl-tRNA synthetase
MKFFSNMHEMQDDLKEFIQSNPDPRELKRATAVQMVLQGYKHTVQRAALP